MNYENKLISNDPSGVQIKGVKIKLENIDKLALHYINVYFL